MDFLRDIATKEDISLLVDRFYEAVLKDDQLAPWFKNLDFNHHLPRMKHFWAFVLLDEPGYTTNVTEKHSHMRLTKELFDAWVKLFHATVDSLFEGEKANLAKERATIMGWTMGSKFDSQQ